MTNPSPNLDGQPELESQLDQLRILEQAARPLEPDADERKRLHDVIHTLAEGYVDGLGDQPGFDHADPQLTFEVSDTPWPLDRITHFLDHDVLRPGCHPASPNHLAYINGGGIYHSALAEYLATASNKYASLYMPGPGQVRLERAMVRWTAELMGYPSTAGGHLASGGSLANLSALVTARDARGLRSADIPTAVVYTTSQTHHCIAKALHVLGMAEATVRHVATDSGHRMRADALAEMIDQDQRRGLSPWLIVATGGSTDVGAVDPLTTIADVAAASGCWLHVDAAYGGFFTLTEYGRLKLAGIERSDSVALNPHKSLFLPWGLGIVLTRDARHMAKAHSENASAHYLQDAVSDDLSPADLSPELTKPFRALRMALPLMLIGTESFRAALDEKLLLARYFYRRIAEAGFQVGEPPDLSVVPFRWVPAGKSDDEVDAINREIHETLLRDGRIFLSSTRLEGRYTLRISVLTVRAHLSTIDLALRLLIEQKDRLSVG